MFYVVEKGVIHTRRLVTNLFDEIFLQNAQSSDQEFVNLMLVSSVLAFPEDFVPYSLRFSELLTDDCMMM